MEHGNTNKFPITENFLKVQQHNPGMKLPNLIGFQKLT